MRNPDEPLFTEDDPAGNPGGTNNTAIREKIRYLIDKQPYAVLCVQGGGQPYGALVAYAFSDDLSHAVFATPTATRKFQLFSECDRIALVIDSRSTEADRFIDIEAVTATGCLRLSKRGCEKDQLSEMLVTRYLYLKCFVYAVTCALFRADVVRFLPVARFQKELGLDPAHSRMAVLVQEMVYADRSGVAFARDPRDTRKAHAVIEAVPGPCTALVDGLVDPDHREIDRDTHDVLAWLPGQRDAARQLEPFLEDRDLQQILQAFLALERLFDWPPDMEWTGGLMRSLSCRPDQ